MRGTRRLRAGLLVVCPAVCLAVALGTTARAYEPPGRFEFAPVADVPVSEDARRLEAMFGLWAGYDSNPARAGDAASESDGVAALAGGVAFAGGNSILRYRAAAEARAARFLDLDAFDFEEFILRGEARWVTQRVRLGLGARHALLAEPADLDQFQFPILERSETLLAPEAEFTAGRAALGLGYWNQASDYDEGALRYLDHSDEWASLDLSWGAAGASRCFLRFETGGVDFDVFDAAHPRFDFDRERLFAGLRARSELGRALELGVGYYAVDGAGVTEEDGLYVTARATRLFGEGSSALEAAYVRDAEASATAEFKTASRVVLRYTRKVNMLWNWSAAYRGQFADLIEPDLAEDESLAHHAFDLGVGRALGSPGRWRGRLHARIRTELGDRFDRVVLSVGASLFR
ncbi:MAG: hypothetical protein ACYTKD_22910 [Planctomycetota bacterium]|jgi:hypothetical protein